MAGATVTAGSDAYEAEIRYTTHGVPHIRAGDWGGLGFGQGYACATDHIGTVADQICKVRGHRSRHLGPGAEDANVDSDIGYAALDLRRRALGTLAHLPDHVVALLDGYAAGVNAWVDRTGPAGLPAWCAHAEWVVPIDAADVLAYCADLAQAASGRNLITCIAWARPPGPEGPAPTPPLTVLGGRLASNAWAVGRDRSASGHGMVMANPHFPWYGEARFWECHLTLPGELDVYGVSLIGAPGVQLGFNRHVAWAHTFSVGKRFVLYRLELEPGTPTRYRSTRGWRDLDPRPVGVEVLGPGGTETVERTIWWSEYGPMLNLPLLGWSESWGIAYRDANEMDDHFLTQWLGMAAAGDLDELSEVFRRENGIPWVNTLAADTSGRTWYIDASHTPNLSEEGLAWYAERVASDPLVGLLDKNRVALLDAALPCCQWVDEPGAPGPGLLPYERLPQLERTDWVMNANGSHWLTNPASPLTGYSPLLGSEVEPPSARTRANLVALAGPGRGPDGRLTAGDLAERVLSNRSVLADVLCDAVVERCRAVGSAGVGGRTVDVLAAADVLAAWDHTYDLAARGAVLWRETMASLPEEALVQPGALFSVPFSVDAPFSTPHTLAPPPAGGPDPVVDAVAGAVLALESAGIPIDTAVEDVQWSRRGARRVPVHGGQECDGVANVLGPVGELPSSSLEPLHDVPEEIPGRTARTGLRRGGYQCTYGTSFLMVVEMTGDGPKGRGLLAYGQSEDAASAHHHDQLDEYAAKRLRPLRFTDADIAADPHLETVVVRGPRQGR